MKEEEGQGRWRSRSYGSGKEAVKKEEGKCNKEDDDDDDEGRR